MNTIMILSAHLTLTWQRQWRRQQPQGGSLNFNSATGMSLEDFFTVLTTTANSNINHYVQASTIIASVIEHYHYPLRALSCFVS
jgi:hypothetical protein